jgi:Tol biopolymer transport system component
MGSRKLVVLAAVLVALIALPALVARAAVTDTTLVSRASGPAGVGANGDSGSGIAVSATGRFIAFESRAGNLSDAATAGVQNIYLRDTQTGTTTLISRASGPDGVVGDGDSSSPTISPVGRYVAFESSASNLTPDGGNSFKQIFIRDTFTNKTRLITRADDGTLANGDSSHPSVSGSAHYVAFESDADNLSTEDVDTVRNVYLRDTTASVTTLVSRAAGLIGPPGDGDSFDPSVSKDGSRIAFASNADNLFNDDRDLYTNVYVYEPRFKLLTHVSRTSTGGMLSDPANGDSTEPVISDDGSHVAFTSVATNLAPGAGPVSNVYVRDLSARSTALGSRADAATGDPGTDASWAPAISGDGLQVAFVSKADNLNPVDDDTVANVYMRNFTYATTTLVSRVSGAAGSTADGDSFSTAISRGADFVAFASGANNLSVDDDDAFTNVFARELPFVPPPPDVPPDLGSNDHSGHTTDEHAVHTAAEHAGHTADEHAGHVTANGAPGETLFGPTVQDVDQLFVLAQVHAPGGLVVTASVKLAGGGRATKVYGFKTFTQNAVDVHRIYRVRLRLSRTGLRTVRRALKRKKRLTAVVVGKARAPTGGAFTTVTRKIRLRD